jgi:ethanolamine utilization microcompartment shell protein EutS
MSDRDFSFDVRDYVAGSQRTAAHLCTLPATNGRFANKVPLPVQGRLINIVGSISGAATVANGDDNIKRIPVEVDEITFLAADGGPTSPVVVSGTVVVNLCSLALRYYRKEIQVLGVFDNSSSCSSSASRHRQRKKKTDGKRRPRPFHCRAVKTYSILANSRSQLTADLRF